MKRFKCIIIGLGPAGISASIYLKRMGHEVLVIGKDYGALAKAETIENYYGFLPIEGKDLIEKGIIQAQKLGVLINHDEVLAIDYLADGFIVKASKLTYEADTVLIATGKARNSFPLAKKYEGLGVSYCATCDGFFYKGKDIAIIGYNDYMLHELSFLEPLANSITIYTNGHELEGSVSENIKVNKEKIIELYGEERFTGIKTENSSSNFAGCFIALGSANAFTMAKHLGLEISMTNDLVVRDYMTNIPGIFAAGDVIGGLLQVVKAASDGASAAMSINKFLKGKK